MQAFDRPTVGCCPSAPAPVRIRGGQSSNWRPLRSCGNGLDRFAKEAAVRTENYLARFVYILKVKSQYAVAAALEEHFLQQRPTSTGIQGINFFINRTILRSDRGTEFIKFICP